MDSAVIFDVDGVLLDLTAAEEDAFFLAFERRYGLTSLSRDWDSYKVRNDEHIIAEILDTHELPKSGRGLIAAGYLAILAQGLSTGSIAVKAIPAASDLLSSLSVHRLGIATANLLSAARLRLMATGGQLNFHSPWPGLTRPTRLQAVRRRKVWFTGSKAGDGEI